jgi:hypothetical protein
MSSGGIMGLFNFKNKSKNVDERDVDKSPSFNTPPSPYKLTASYIQQGSRYGTIVKLANQNGMNHSRAYSWAVDFLPNINVPGVKGYLFWPSVVKTEQQQKDIFNEEIDNLQKSVENNGLNRFSSKHEREVKEGNVQDIENAKSDIARNDKVVDSEIKLLLVSDEPDKISQQLMNSQRYYNEVLNGIEVTSTGGDQEELFLNLMKPPKPSKFNFTWTTSDMAGNDHFVRRGLNDEHGWAIGKLNASYSQGMAMMDLDGRFDRKKKRNGSIINGEILVAASPTSKVHGFENYDGLSSSSLWGQLIAHHAQRTDKRTFHIVLNGFDYYNSIKKGEDKFVLSDSFMEDAAYIDLSYGGLNPIEGWGEYINANSIYSDKISNLAQIFYLLSNRSLTEQALNDLQQALNGYYKMRGYWSSDAAQKGKGFMARFFNLNDHKHVTTLGDFVVNIKNAMEEEAKGEMATEMGRDRLKTLQTTLTNALHTHPEMFNSISTLPNRVGNQYAQYYYDLSRLRTEPNVLEAQFINALPYILANASYNDIVMIHGLDQISVESWEYLKTAIKAAKGKGVRFAYLFDNISGKIEKNNQNNNSEAERKRVQMLNLFSAHKVIYNDLTSDFDYVITGLMGQDELKEYQKLVSAKGTLPEYMIEAMSKEGARDNTHFQISSSADRTNTNVSASFGI